MRNFFIRFFVYASLWGGYLYQCYGKTDHFSLLLFLFAFVLCSYFLLPVVKNALFLYLFIAIIICVMHMWVAPITNPYAILLLLYLSMEACSQLTVRHFHIITVVFMILTGIIVLATTGWKWEWLFFFLLFFTLTLLLNRSLVERKEQRDIYEQLLGEYRQIKRLSLEADRSARLEERTRIAREIHDSVGHKLTALLMTLEIQSMTNGESYSDLKKLAKESLSETRQAVKALRTEEHYGMASVLQLIRKLESESHIHLNLIIKQGVLTTNLTNQKNIVLYRVIQEALTNAMRHSASREVEVTLGKTATGDVEFKVMNRVYDAKPLQWGFGLTNMRERVEEIGGRLTAYRTDEQFIVNGSFPVEE